MAKTPSSGNRELKKRVKTARGRSISSVRWLNRQINDPYVSRAKREGYRSRAAFKLLELDDRFGWLKPGKNGVGFRCGTRRVDADCGAAREVG